MTAPEAPAPAEPKRKRASRIIGVDVARGIALITMASTHMLPTSDDATGGLTTVGWLFAGRASALFALLAGISLAIITGGRTVRTGRDLRRARVHIAVRAAIIGLIGLLLAGTNTPVAVILQYYAVLFLLALPFLRVPARWLFALGVVWALLSPQLSFLIRQSMPASRGAQVDVATLLTDPVASVQNLLFTGYYPAFTWLTFVLFGLALGRIDIGRTRTQVWLVVVGAVVAVGAWLTSAAVLQTLDLRVPVPTDNGPVVLRGWELNLIEWYGTTPKVDADWLWVAGAHSGTTFDLLTVTGSAFFALGLCLLAVRADLLRKLLHPFAAAGAMTLTLYTTHVLVLSFDIAEFGSVPYYLWHVVVGLTFASFWLARFPKGPLEQLVSSAANGLAAKAVPALPAAPAQA